MRACHCSCCRRSWCMYLSKASSFQAASSSSGGLGDVVSRLLQVLDVAQRLLDCAATTPSSDIVLQAPDNTATPCNVVLSRAGQTLQLTKAHPPACHAQPPGLPGFHAGKRHCRPAAASAEQHSALRRHCCASGSDKDLQQVSASVVIGFRVLCFANAWRGNLRKTARCQTRLSAGVFFSSCTPWLRMNGLSYVETSEAGAELRIKRGGFLHCLKRWQLCSLKAGAKRPTGAAQCRPAARYLANSPWVTCIYIGRDRSVSLSVSPRARQKNVQTAVPTWICCYG